MQSTQLLGASCRQMPGWLSGWLKKARDRMPGGDAEGHLFLRLAPDMFPFSTQVHFACVQTWEAVYRLKGEGFPAPVAELVEERT